jgi:hypothetical protein
MHFFLSLFLLFHVTLFTFHLFELHQRKGEHTFSYRFSC